MSYAANDFNLGKNIRRLRKSYGETQLDLAIAIGVSGSSVISQYESGERVPEREYLFRIAKHYRITEYELLNGDFKDTRKFASLPVGDATFGMEVLKRMLPIVCTERAREHPKFKDAYVLHNHILDAIMEDAEIEEDDFEKCLDLYKAARAEGIVEAAANHLWWLMFIGFAMSQCTPQLIEYIDMEDISKITGKSFFRGYLPSFDETSNEKEVDANQDRSEFLKENELDLVIDIMLLRKSKEFSDLGDYYLALRHIFSLLRNTLDPEMNKLVGGELLLTFSLMGNKYCDDFLSI